MPVEELLGSLGLWGCLWSALQGLPLELHTLLGAAWSPAVAVPFFGFGVAMFAFYRCGGRPAGISRVCVLVLRPPSQPQAPAQGPPRRW